MIVNDIIRELMYQQNKKIVDISKETKLDYETIYNIVVNDINPKTKDADIILRVLGESLDKILKLY